MENNNLKEQHPTKALAVLDFAHIVLTKAIKNQLNCEYTHQVSGIPGLNKKKATVWSNKNNIGNYNKGNRKQNNIEVRVSKEIIIKKDCNDALFPIISNLVL